MNKTVFELIKSHFSYLGTNLQDVKLPFGTKEIQGLFQLDFLSWYVGVERLESYGVPFDVGTIKDNPNWIPTDYENVYMMAEYRGENVMVDYQLILPGKSPVKLINWRYFKVRSGDKYDYRWRVCIYGKALKLYYMGYLPRLKEYVIKYGGECCRADLCWDFPFQFPIGVVDLKVTGTNHSTTYLGEKNSPIFFRIYDKTQDLKRDKNCNARMYPSWYQKECWRIEAQLSGNYSRSMTPIDWLDIDSVDKSKIQKQKSVDRNVYKTALYSVINTIDWISMSNEEKLDILLGGKKVVDIKIKKLQKSLL